MKDELFCAAKDRLLGVCAAFAKEDLLHPIRIVIVQAVCRRDGPGAVTEERPRALLERELDDEVERERRRHEAAGDALLKR